MENLYEDDEMENTYPGGIITLASDLSYLNNDRLYNNGKYADLSSIMHGLKDNRQQTENLSDFTREYLGAKVETVQTGLGFLQEGQRAQVITNEFNRVCEKLNQINVENRDNQIAAERRSDDKFTAINDRLSSIALENLKQFCDLKELHKETQKSIEVTALSSENRNLRDQLEEQRFRECCPPRVTPVDPCCSSSSSVNDIAAAVINQLTPVLNQQAQAMNSIASAIATLKPGNS